MTAEAEILTELKEVKAILNVALFMPEWMPLKEACHFKGVNYNTVRIDKRLCPRFGMPDKMNGAQKLWNKRTIAKWLPFVGLGDVPQYAALYPDEYKLI